MSARVGLSHIPSTDSSLGIYHAAYRLNISCMWIAEAGSFRIGLLHIVRTRGKTKNVGDPYPVVIATLAYMYTTHHDNKAARTAMDDTLSQNLRVKISSTLCLTTESREGNLLEICLMPPYIIRTCQHTARNCYPQENIIFSMFFCACHDQKLIFFVDERSLCSLSEGLQWPLAGRITLDAPLECVC